MNHPTIQSMGSTFKFIQVGANDGITGPDPLRKYILSMNWTGILIEPQPAIFETLKKNYFGSTNLIFENVGISDADQTLTLYVPSGDSTTASFNKEVIQDQSALIGVNVPCISLKGVIEKYDFQQIDLLQIDTEGFEWPVLNSLEISKHKPNIIQFEHGHMSRNEINRTIELLTDEGYLIYFGGKQHQDSLAILKKFAVSLNLIH